MRARDLYLGIDLGGSKILCGVVTANGKILSRAKSATPFAEGSAALLEALRATASAAMQEAGIPRARLAAIGMGSPGPLDPARGTILRTPNIAVKKLAVGPWLSRQLEAPVFLDNDVHMAVYGEWLAGAARGMRRVVGLWIGTGVGGCVLWEGRVVHGINRNAGEIGHMVLDARRARPGKARGTLEWEASKTGIARHLRKAVRRGKKSKLARRVERGGERLHSTDLAKAFEAGDRPTVAAVENSARYVGLAIANLFDVLAPELFVLGGGVSAALGSPYLELVRRAAREHAFTTELARPRIVLSRLKDDAGLLGAALAARDGRGRPEGAPGGSDPASP
ncbi:MAG: ROK family protein [Acidobacteria bacterium]|nr:ROK family protein [Acidobacteriota bacterium]MCA1609905.1 ROK family protein [Acidobacteriota bacterium]